MLNKVLILYILLTFYTWSAKAESVSTGKCRDGITKNVSPHQLLRQDLFCSYDKENLPVNDSNKNVTVNATLIILSFNMDENRNVLEVHGWLQMIWLDEGLKWNPADYSNVDVLHVKSYDIWEPDITLYNSGNLEDIGTWDFTHCEVNSTGIVYCIPNTKWSVQCTANLQQWPFDQHNCTMMIGSWVHPAETIDIKLPGEGILLNYLQKNSEWELLNSSATRKVSTYDCCPNSTYLFVDFGFLIKRHADAYAATVMFPSLALTMLTLVSYWLDPIKSNRIALCSFSTLCHCLYLQYLGLKLPVNGTMTPIIILLYRDSLIITTVAMVLAVVVERLTSSNNDNTATSVPIPAWLDRFFGVVSNQKAGQLLLGNYDSTRGDGASLMENGPKSDEGNEKHGWIILVTIINRLGFLISLIIYFVLYIALIPKY